ncbi:MAG TPA: NAD-glutamate dehydrogenase [Trebonia sp.]
MPERAAEAKQAPDDIRDELIAKAAELWTHVHSGAAAEVAADGGVAPPGDAGRVVGDLPGFLSAYYRLVAVEDLIAAGPVRLAATAARHTALGAQRPQGRPAVSVRPEHDASLTWAGTVIDIVTDDMPYLVDSVTMELNRQHADIRLIVHPLFTVHRDVTGAAHGTGAAVTDADAVRESWMHVELGAVDDPARLAADLRRVLDDLRVAMEDQRRMRSAARDLVELLADAGDPEGTEASELLAWLSGGHFTFLGYRAYAQAGEGDELKPVPGTGLGILRYDVADESFDVSPAGGGQGRRRSRLLVLAKSSTKSTVYRPSYLDYVAVRRFSPQTGEVTGEYRFLGLYTQAAYTESITRVPVLRRKLDRMLDIAGVPADSHDGKALLEILEGFPREELFEISAERLAPIALAVLGLGERKQVRLFLRPDSYGRYVSCLVYLPRDRYTTQVRLRAQEILRSAFGGASVDYSAMVGNSALARLHIVVHAEPGRQLATVDQAALQARIAAAVRSWEEDLAAEAERQLGPEMAIEALGTCADGIPETYKAATAPAAAVADLAVVRRLRDESAGFAIRLSLSPAGDMAQPGHQPPGQQPATVPPDSGVWRLRVYQLSPLTLSDVLPQLQHMGLEVLDEHPYEFRGTTQPFWIYDFGIRGRRRALTQAQADSLRTGFEQALTALWQDRIEDDGFNGLVLDADLSWRQVAVLRAYARYLRQAGLQFSQSYLQRVLRANPGITRLLVRLFESRFDPALASGAEERCTAITEELRGALDEVVSLDHDRILRAYLALIDATLRTNYYQYRPGGRPPVPPEGAPDGTDHHRIGHAGDGDFADYLVFKLASARVPVIPAPRPKYEIWAYSPRFEAVHLRFGPVARGGLRWSERPEDFRTEVLGLVKAQEVKNSVIVPSGAKGGFVCKRLPDPADRDAYLGEVLACYRAFISAMLDITDNIVGDAVVPPSGVVRLDGDDPYLVVAADKGTATFSDVANEVAGRYGYWLGDAFASGGSVGYDHKKMGITARGAWESVRWHFAALRLNPDTDDFTAVGIGDMSGDVFGNGMLLSRHIKLVAAFDHRHVFLDPDPDPAASFAERQRLFDVPRSSWAEYDRALISTGGGVWPRSAKSVPISAQARAALGLDAGVTALSPDEVISAILRAPVDLLWNGGIGTWVKASHETHADAGDRSSDAVRINATDLRARVIGEGGNLGLTQAARIEYALAGGLVNTDFIDNSAGVDTSDHEVNIKILLAGAIAAGELRPEERGALLHQLTDEVAAHVLRHNDGQNMALAAARFQAPRLLHVHARYLRRLLRDNRVSLETDGLPDEKEIAARRSASTGLTTPELAVLLAHTKIAAGQQVLASDLPDDPSLRPMLAGYFPVRLAERFTDQLGAHRLRREIITTEVINEMVDTGGTTYLFRLGEETGLPVVDITRAWLVAREVFGMHAFWQQVEAMAGTVDVDARIAVVLEARKLVERATRWLLVNRRPSFGIAETVNFFSSGVATVRSSIPRLLSGSDLSGYEERRASYTGSGVPAGLADQVAAMVPSYSAFDIVTSAAATKHGVEETAAVYFLLADRLQLCRLRDLIVALPRDDRWAAVGRSALRDDLYDTHAALTRDVLAVGSGSTALTGAYAVVGSAGSAADRVAAWEAANAAEVSRAAATLAEIWESNRFTFTTLSVAVRVIRTLVSPGA